MWTPCSSGRIFRFVRSLLTGGVFGKTVSSSPYLPLWGTFTVYCEGTVQLAFRSFSERIVPYVVVDSVCSWEELSSGSSCTTNLDRGPGLIFDYSQISIYH